MSVPGLAFSGDDPTAGWSTSSRRSDASSRRGTRPALVPARAQPRAWSPHDVGIPALAARRPRPRESGRSAPMERSSAAAGSSVHDGLRPLSRRLPAPLEAGVGAASASARARAASRGGARLPIWRAVGHVLRGAAMARRGDRIEGLARMPRHRPVPGARRPRRCSGRCCSRSGRGRRSRSAGRRLRGPGLIDEAIETIRQGGRCCTGVRTTQGGLLLSPERSRRRRAELPARLRRLAAKLEAADRPSCAPPRGSRVCESTMRPRSNRCAASTKRSSEGFDSPDLVEARAVLAGVDVPIREA